LQELPEYLAFKVNIPPPWTDLFLSVLGTSASKRQPWSFLPRPDACRASSWRGAAAGLTSGRCFAGLLGWPEKRVRHAVGERWQWNKNQIYVFPFHVFVLGKCSKSTDDASCRSCIFFSV